MAQDVEAVDVLEVEELVVAELEDTAKLPVAMLLAELTELTALTAKKPAT